MSDLFPELYQKYIRYLLKRLSQISEVTVKYNNNTVKLTLPQNST